jgi:hypothetical protein
MLRKTNKSRQYIMDLSPDVNPLLQDITLDKGIVALVRVITSVMEAGNTDNSIYINIGHTKTGDKYVVSLKGLDNPPQIIGSDWDELSVALQNAAESLCEPL